ncbi:hypothetical protein [Actinoallomurus sp. NPDC050550]|uniref:hypothetical protein n=1 Tax=Actinoallomurus sp. NPDC050550 TaxID=3154937 RepID=UPI0033C50CCF
MYLPRQDGSKLGIAAGQRNDGAWDFLWGRTRTPRLADQLSESSRGLFLIAELAVRSGYMRTGQGGRYWFEL